MDTSMSDNPQPAIQSQKVVSIQSVHKVFNSGGGEPVVGVATDLVTSPAAGGTDASRTTRAPDDGRWG